MITPTPRRESCSDDFDLPIINNKTLILTDNHKTLLVTPDNKKSNDEDMPRENEFLRDFCRWRKSQGLFVPISWEK